MLRQYQPPPDATHPQAADAAQGQNGGSPAMRVFTPGEDILYGYQILNRPLGFKSKDGDRKLQPRLSRRSGDFCGKPQPMNADGQTDLKRMVGGGVLKLGGTMKPGDYVLQVVVTDKVGKETATQWSDFEVKDPAASQ